MSAVAECGDATLPLTKTINKLTELDATILHASTALHLKQNSRYKIFPLQIQNFLLVGNSPRLRTHALTQYNKLIQVKSIKFINSLLL